jgi:c-di-GMP-binding flagellar brake protein YcgR
MNEPEVLKSEEVKDVLGDAVQKKLTAVVSYLSGGRWHMMKVSLCALTGNTLHVETLGQETGPSASMGINQPVGMSVQQDYNKYMFETVVAGLETSVSQARGRRIAFELPDTIDRMQRRAYGRIPVPKSLNVRVLFWHRGYTDESRQVPLENYWQGKLLDISAGGVHIAVELEQGPNFKVGQLVGLQFTPMSYQKPIHVEGQVRRVALGADGQRLDVGVEFVGLEAGSQGRQKLRQIINAVNHYERKNRRRGKAAEVVADDWSEEAEIIAPVGSGGTENTDGLAPNS